MYSTYKYTSDENPEQNRDPPEHGGIDRPEDRSRTGNRGEVMSEKHWRLGRYVVNTIALRVCGSSPFGIKIIPPGQVPPVEDVSDS